MADFKKSRLSNQTDCCWVDPDCCWVCWSIAIGTILVFIIPIGLLIFYHPPPTATPIFAVESISATPITISSFQITAGWNITVLVKNRYQQTTLYFDAIEASVYYKDVVLASAAVNSFYRAEGSGGVVEVKLAARGAAVEKWAADAIAGDRDAKGVVEFDVKVDGRVLFSPGTKSKSMGWVIVNCRGLNVDANSGGLIDDGSKDDDGLRWCKVQIVDIFLPQQAKLPQPCPFGRKGKRAIYCSYGIDYRMEMEMKNIEKSSN
ncbi:hypothetical protein LguiB_001375 [Lonicera macranthoides]